MSLVYRLADAAADMASLATNAINIGMFRAAMHSLNDLPLLDYAVPWASPWSYEQVRLALTHLREHFERHQRPLRIEFIREAWPWLDAVLEAQGFTCVSRTRIMACTPATFRPRQSPGVEVAVIPAEAEILLRKYAFIQEEVFFCEDTAQEIAYQISCGFWQCALATLDGEPAGAGSLVRFGRQNELAAVATLEYYRRKGVASTLSSYLVSSYFDNGGDLAWLAVTTEAARAVYEGIGFVVVGEKAVYS